MYALLPSYIIHKCVTVNNQNNNLLPTTVDYVPLVTLFLRWSSIDLKLCPQLTTCPECNMPCWPTFPGWYNHLQCDFVGPIATLWGLKAIAKVREWSSKGWPYKKKQTKMIITLLETNSKSTWKWMVGKVVSFSDGPFSGAFAVSFREGSFVKSCWRVFS